MVWVCSRGHRPIALLHVGNTAWRPRESPRLGYVALQLRKTASLLSASVGLPALGASQTWNHTIRSALCLAPLTQRDVFQVRPGCCLRQPRSFLWLSDILGMNQPSFVYLSISWWTFFPPWGCCYTAPVNIQIQVLWDYWLSVILGIRRVQHK